MGDFGGTIITGLTGNKDFPSPPVAIADLTTLLTAFNDAVVSEASFGPELSRIADKLAPVADKVDARRWLVQWLLNPNVYHPRSRMPITHLSVSDANDV